MAKDLVFESERYEKHRRLRLILLPIVFLAAVLILAALAALLIGYFRGQSHTGGENLAYPYTWRAGRNGVVTLELDHATVPDDIWQYEETSGVLDVTGGKQTKTVTRFTLTPTATGRALSVFRLTENGSDVYELSVLTETQSVDGAMQTEIVSATGRPMQAELTGSDESGLSYRIYYENDRLIIAVTTAVNSEGAFWTCASSDEKIASSVGVISSGRTSRAYVSPGGTEGSCTLTMKNESTGAALTVECQTDTDGVLTAVSHELHNS